MKSPNSNISKKVTAFLLWMLFYMVVGFSLFLSPGLTWGALAFALLKGGIAVVCGLFFFLIVSDSVVKAIRQSFADMEERRREGGLLFHFLNPSENEIIESPSIKMNGKKDKKGK